MNLAALPRKAYTDSLLRTARAMLGQRLVREEKGTRTVGRIVELEAYGGALDPSAHSWRRRTERNASMFGEAGHAYVYLSYGVHWCLNLVAGERDLACAILIRGVELEQGIEVARRRRAAACRSPRLRARIAAGHDDRILADGPGKLSVAFATDHRFDGHDLTRAEGLWLAPGRPARHVRWSPRIGLGAVGSRDWSWRAIDADSAVVPAHPGPWHARPTPSLTQARGAGLRANAAKTGRARSRAPGSA